MSCHIRKTQAIRWLMLVGCLMTAVMGFAGVKTSEKTDSLTATKVFADIPLQVLDMLRPSSRLDMLDYYEHADSLLTVADALGGQSRFEMVAPDYLKVYVTPVSTLEIKLLPYKKGNLVMTLYTVGGEGIAKDTQVDFFDSDLKPLSAKKFLKDPDMKQFFNLRDSKVSLAEIVGKVPFSAVEYSTGPGDAPLTATFTTLSTLSEETSDLLNPLLIPSLSAPWTGKFKF